MARYSGHSGHPHLDPEEPDEPNEPNEPNEPSGPEPLGWRGSGSCLFCGRSGTEWQHDLDRALVGFRTRFDRGHIWSSVQVLCDECEQRYRRGDYLSLARFRADHSPGGEAVEPDRPDDGPDGGYDRSLRIQDQLIALAAFCRADLRVRMLVAPDFPAGFEPVEEYTGAEWVTEVWPSEFRSSVAENRPGHVEPEHEPEHEPDARVWLLRSPWPSLSLSETFAVLWSWAESFRDEQTPTQIRGRVVEALAWTDAQAVEWLARQ